MIDGGQIHGILIGMVLLVILVNDMTQVNISGYSFAYKPTQMSGILSLSGGQYAVTPQRPTSRKAFTSTRSVRWLLI